MINQANSAVRYLLKNTNTKLQNINSARQSTELCLFVHTLCLHSQQLQNLQHKENNTIFDRYVPKLPTFFITK